MSDVEVYLIILFLLIIINVYKSDESKYESRNKILATALGLWILGGLLATWWSADVFQECIGPSMTGTYKCR